MNLKMQALKLTTSPPKYFDEYGGPWNKKGWEPLV
jgi:hypothetical protein